MSRLTSTELCTALAAGAVDVFYQPIAAWSGHGSWQICGVEALVRCTRSSGERVPPDRVLPVAERAGMIGQLTHYVLSHALTSLRSWQEQGLSLQVAVNLHAESLMDTSLADRVVGMAQAHGIEPRRLTLEISERTPVVDLRRARETLNGLRAAGVRVALDDFGTGFALFTRIDTLPCDVIKIDKSLVLNMRRTQEAENAVAALIELGHSRGLSVCAEGVEDERALRKLGNLDCNMVQGYLLAQAMPMHEVPACVREWNSGDTSRISRHFQQHVLPGIPGTTCPANDSCTDTGLYVRVPAA
jgi:EAL domain-containing protein (putative c-di-GMP-specific phosphodiesterase class I)